MAKYRVGLIGAGRKGTQHARAYVLNPHTEVVAVADTDAENLELFTSRFGVPGYADYRQMLAQEALDIAAPILPVRYNTEVVLGCAEAGVKAILCEKPLSVTLAEADRMVAVCAVRNIRFGAGDLDINLPAYQQAAALIHAGELGEVRSITFRGGGGHEMSGGGCQIFSLMRLFAASDAAWVNGWVTDDPWSDYDQGVAGYIRFLNGVEAFIQRQPDGRGRGFDVACSEGVFRTDGMFMEIYKTGAAKDLPAWQNLKKIEGVLPEGNIYGARTYDEQGWRWPGDRNMGSVAALVDSIALGRDPQGSGDNGCRVLEMAIALRQSQRQGQSPVALPLVERTLQIVPHATRLENKKGIFGREKYMPQVRDHKKDVL